MASIINAFVFFCFQVNLENSLFYNTEIGSIKVFDYYSNLLEVIL